MEFPCLKNLLTNINVCVENKRKHRVLNSTVGLNLGMGNTFTAYTPPIINLVYGIKVESNTQEIIKDLHDMEISLMDLIGDKGIMISLNSSSYDYNQDKHELRKSVSILDISGSEIRALKANTTHSHYYWPFSANNDISVEVMPRTKSRTRFMFQTGDIITHVKTQNNYAIFIGPEKLRLESTGEPAYCYGSTDDLWVRDAKEMEDGRFVLLRKGDTK